MAKNNIKESDSRTVWTKPYYGGIEYEMPQQMAQEILATRKGEERNMHPQAFLRKVVNETFGLKGNCVKVITV